MGDTNLSGLLDDAPLEDPDDDLLGRAPFSKALAEAILALDAKRGFVLALFGEWGSGKTTALNFVLHYLDELAPEADRPVVVRFNPWWYSGEEQLLTMFLAQVRAALGKQDRSPMLVKAGRQIESFAKALSLAKYVPGAAAVAAPLAELLMSSGEVVTQAGERLAADLTALKESISEALRQQDRRILIVIDDIDRLTSDEVRTMLRLIKSVVAFPNTVYLLAFDRNVVVDALRALHPTSGDAFLEKIVQASFHLPMLSSNRLQRMLAEGLTQLTRGTPEDLRDNDRWTSVFRSALAHFLQGPRDVKRLLNALTLTYPVVEGEVNAADFAALELLRVFVPRVYEVIRNNQDLFVDPHPSWTEGHTDTGQNGSIVESYISESVPAEDSEATETILCGLFPEYRRVVGRSGPPVVYGPGFASVWRRELRICSPDIFPVYFRLSLDEGQISADVVRVLLRLTEHPGALTNELIRLAQKLDPDGVSEARRALGRLHDHADSSIPSEVIPSVIEALCNAADSIIEADRNSPPPDSTGLLVDIVRRLLHHVADQATRFEILSQVISGCRSLAVIVELLELAQYTMDRPELVADWLAPAPLVSREQLGELQQLTLERIRSASSDGTLGASPHLPVVLAWWRELSGSSEVPRGFISNACEDDQKLVRFLEWYLSGKSRPDTSPQETMHIPGIRQWLDLEALRERAELLLSLPPQWLDERGTLALRTFLRELNHAPEGYDDFGRVIQSARTDEFDEDGAQGSSD